MNGAVLGTVHFLQGTQKKRLKRGASQETKGGKGGSRKIF